MEEKLILDNMNLIYKVIQDMHLYWNTDDEYQAHYDNGLVGLINGAKTFDETQSKPSTYLYKCIKNMIVRGIQLSEMQNRKINKQYMISLDDLVSDDDDRTRGEMIEDPNVNVEEEVEKKIQYETIVKAIDLLENKKDALAVKMYYQVDGYSGGNYENIAKKWGVSRSMIYCRIQRAIPKIKEKVREIERKGIMLEESKEKNNCLIAKTQKKCIFCGQIKPSTEFSFKSSNQLYRKQYCRECEKINITKPLKVKKITPEPVKLKNITITQTNQGIAFFPNESIDPLTEIKDEITRINDDLKLLEEKQREYKIKLDTLEWCIQVMKRSNKEVNK